MRIVRQLTLGAMLACSLVSSYGNALAAEVSFGDLTDGELAILIDGQQVAVYYYQDDEISRPYFAHLRAPGAPQVSRNHPPVEDKDRTDHPTFHPGLWMSFGDIRGSDYWRLAAPVKHVERVELPQGGTDHGSFAVRNQYRSQEDPSQVVCEEVCRFAIKVRPAGYLLLWDATFSSNEEFYFGDQEEMGIGIRVATSIRVEQDAVGDVPAGNGTMVDSEGRRNGKEIWGNSADWCDYSGIIEGQHVGMTLICHPDNFRPSWFHARDYGLLVANPFGRESFRKGETSKVVVKPGEKLRLRYGVLVHASPEGESPDLQAAYEDFVSATRP